MTTPSTPRAVPPSTPRAALAALIAATALAITSATPAAGGPCDAHFRFDGDLSDSGGSGYDGQLVVAGGEPATFPAVFEPGKFGRALKLDGQTVMYSPLDLQTETCPQVTISAWVFVGEHPQANQLVSTGYGRGPALHLGSYHLKSSAGGSSIRVNSAVRRGQWIFVAGTWDYDAGVQRLYWRHRWEEDTFPDQSRPPQEGFWVGASAYFTALHYIAEGLLIDELRVWGRVLSEDELREVQAAGNPALTPCDCDAAGGGDPGFGRGPVDVGYVPPPDPEDLLRDSAAGALPEPSPEDGSSDRRDTTEALLEARPVLPLAPPGGSATTPEAEEGSGEPAEQTPSGEPPADDAPRGEPRPAGTPSYSSVAGNTGSNKRLLDLADTFFESIWWSEKTDRPCFMRVAGSPGSDPRIETLELGCDIGLRFHTVDVYGYGIGGLEVCNNDNARGRLKGIRVYGTKIESDGSTTYAPVSDEEALTNCKVWSPMVLCPGDKLATGLVVHSNDASGNVEQIVGLQLICRSITVE